MTTNNFNIKRTNPNAMVFIYNYRDRLGDTPLSKDTDRKRREIDPTFQIDQIILNTTSLLSVKTNKTKASPAGTFEIRLAPTKNWVTAITPGSWCIILMSNSEIDDKAKYGGGRVDEKSFKMLGRIESVRGVIEVDQTTGARRTAYLVQGADWGTIFDSILYVDPLNRSGFESALGMATRYGYNKYLEKAVAYERWKTGKKANEESPATVRPDKPASKEKADLTSDFLKSGVASVVDQHTQIDFDFSETTGTPTETSSIGIPAGLTTQPQDQPTTEIVIDPFTGIISEIPAIPLRLESEEPLPPETTEEKKAASDAADVAKEKTAKTKTEPIGTRLPSAAESVKFLLALWGQTDPVTAAMQAETDLLGKALQRFRIPQKAAEYMRFKDNAGNVSGVISQVITPVVGKLTGVDKYSGEDQSAGLIDFRTLLGEHTMWQVLTDNCNSPINELIPEIRFENGAAKMALYQRVRPFAVKKDNIILADAKEVGDGRGVNYNPDFVGPKNLDQIKAEERQSSLARNYLSKFKNVKTKLIDLDDVITCNFGTNWRDKYNFVEVNIGRSIFQEAFSNAIKLESQFKDANSIGRDGLKSMIQSFAYVPVDKSGVQSVLDTFVYKYALKEWYFNTHKMLNGNIQLIGQDQYIQVGDNIRVKAEALGPAKNISAAQKASRKFTYLTAHVESIAHNAGVDPNGARTFITNINFTRGIITDETGKPVDPNNSGAVDQDGRKTTPSVEKNKATFGTSSSKDPDRQKSKGK